MKHIDVQIQESQQTTSKIKPKKSIPKHVLVKMLKTKDEESILKAVEGVRGDTTERRTAVQIMGDFSSETTEAGRQQRIVV